MVSGEFAVKSRQLTAHRKGRLLHPAAEAKQAAAEREPTAAGASGVESDEMTLSAAADPTVVGLVAQGRQEL